MRRGEIDASAAADPGELQSVYESLLRETIARVGEATVVDRTGLDRATVEDVQSADCSDLTLEDAAAILATDPDRPDADTVAAEARDILLLGMTTAVVDVDSLASQLDGVLEPKELQQKVEGRHPMTVGEYATIHFELTRHGR